MSQITEELQSANVTEDFTSVQSYVDLVDGVVAASIDVQIRDDDRPEVDEVFIVRLTGVALVTGADSSNMPPKLGMCNV